ncbi:MAG: thioredoxin family protein [bacterium]|nr:thioredoxin family protein [bacterium]
MNKKALVIVSVVVGLLLVGGGALAYTNNQNDKKEQEKMAMEKNTEDEAMMKKNEAAAMEEDKMAKEGDAMAVKGSYTAYDQAKLANAEKGDVVIFFHAGWCPKCKESDKNFSASVTPEGLTLLKVDYDNSTELKQKYGVTMQHTYVQVDKDGNEIKQWNGSYTYDDLKSQIN